MAELSNLLSGHVIDEIYTVSDGSVYVLSTINDYDGSILNNGGSQTIFLSRFDGNLSNNFFSKQIFSRPIEDVQLGAEQGSFIVGEHGDGVTVVTGGSNITSDTYSSVLTVSSTGEFIDTTYAGKSSSGSIKFGSGAINVDHGDAHFFASEGDTNEVTIRLIPDPAGISTGGHILKSYYTVDHPYGAMPPDVDVHAQGGRDYIISVANRSDDRLISVENFDLEGTLSTSFLYEGNSSSGSFEVDHEGPFILKIDGHQNKGELSIKLSGYPNGTYSSRVLSGDGNFSSGDLNKWVFITDLQPASQGWQYEITSSDSTDYGNGGFKPSLTLIDADPLSYFQETTLLEYYNSNHDLIKTIDIGPVQDPKIISGDGFDLVLGNERFEGADVKTVVKKIATESGDIEWSVPLIDEPSKISDAIFTDNGDLLVGGVEFLHPSNMIFTKLIDLDGNISNGPTESVSTNDSASVLFYVDKATATLKTIVSVASGEIQISDSGDYFSLNPSAPEKANEYVFNMSLYEDLDATEGNVVFSSRFLDRYFIDPDGDELFYSFIDGPDFIFESNGSFLMPFTDHTVGVHEITIQVSDRDPMLNDPSTKFIFHSYNVTVSNYPEAPTVKAIPDVVIQHDVFNNNILDLSDYFDDEDLISNPEETLSFTAEGLPNGLTLDPLTGIIAGSVTGSEGASTVLVTATDSSGKSASSKFNLEMATTLQDWILSQYETHVWNGEVQLGRLDLRFDDFAVPGPDGQGVLINSTDVDVVLDNGTTVPAGKIVYAGQTADLSELMAAMPGIQHIRFDGSSGSDWVDFSQLVSKGFLPSDVESSIEVTWSDGDDYYNLPSENWDSAKHENWFMPWNFASANSLDGLGISFDQPSGLMTADYIGVEDVVLGSVQISNITKISDTRYSDTVSGSEARDSFKFGNGGEDTVAGDDGSDKFRISGMYQDGSSYNYTLKITDYESNERISLEDYNFDAENWQSEISITFDQGANQTQISINTQEYNVNSLVKIDGEYSLVDSRIQSDGDVELYFHNLNLPIEGTSGDDTLYGTDFDDTIKALDGNDQVWASLGDDVIDGGGGNDTLRLNDSSSGVQVDLEQGLASGDGIGNNQISNFERVRGSDFDDILRGSDTGDNWESFSGNGGDDIIDGRGGNDYVWYGRSVAPINVDLSTGIVTGGEGTDQLHSIEGVSGSNYGDVLVGSDGDDLFHPDVFSGDDELPNFRVGGADFIDGGAGVDTVSYFNTQGGDGFVPEGIDANLLLGAVTDPAGNVDTLSNIENINGSNYDDLITGDEFSNQLKGNDGDDFLVGGAGDDVLDGGSGNDTLDGGIGSDKFDYRKGDGNDIILGFEEGVDEIRFFDFTDAEQDQFLSEITPEGHTLMTLSDGSTILKKAVASSSAFTISKLSQSGDTVVFGLYVDPSQDPGGDGIGSFSMMFDYDPSVITVDDTLVTFGAGLSGQVGTHDTSTGQIEIGGFAFPSVTEFSLPFMEVTATLVDASQPVVLNVASTAFDDVDVDSSTATFEFNSHELSGTITSRGGGILSDVAVTVDVSGSDDDLTATTSEAGGFLLEVDDGVDLSVLADLTHINATPTKAITPHDALEALRLSVGLDTTTGSKTAYNYMAADFNQNGKVTPHDALEILKYSVGLRDLDTDWKFIDSNGDYSDISRTNTVYDEGVSAQNITANLEVSMTGVLLGDVNDTYTNYLDIA